MPTTPLAMTAPSPRPTPGIDPDQVTPGVLGFVIFAVIAIAAVLLIVDMVRRIRRVNARARARERIAAELASTPEPDTEPEDAGPDDAGPGAPTVPADRERRAGSRSTGRGTPEP